MTYLTWGTPTLGPPHDSVSSLSHPRLHTPHSHLSSPAPPASLSHPLSHPFPVYRERGEASAFTAALDDYRQYLRRKFEAQAMAASYNHVRRAGCEGRAV